MQIDVQTVGAAGRVRIAGEMTIYSASDLKPKLLGALADCRELEISAAEVTEMDTSGVQLLLLAKQEAARAGKTLRLVAPSPAVQDVLACYRLAADLDSPRPGRAEPPSEPITTRPGA